LRKAGPLIGAPLVPLVGVGFLAALCGLIGLLYRAGRAGPIVAGVLAFLPLFLGGVMTMIFLGLAAGWALMVSAVAVEGEDSFDALSRAYSYVFQRPARYAGYLVLGAVVGTIGVLVVTVFSRLLLELAAWGLAFGAPDATIFRLFREEPT